MTSINYNASATSALRTLQSTNMQLDSTQSRISTGLKIGEAKDNAAYWSISTTLKSDNKALGTVDDALGLGAATVDTAYQGLNQTLEVLNEIKSKLTAATQGSVDKTKVMSEVKELQEQLKSIANASTFSGENWLAIPSGAANFAKSVVSGFTRAANGQFSLSEIAIDTTTFALTDADGARKGILETGGIVAASGDLATLATNIKNATLTDSVAANTGGTAVFNMTTAQLGVIAAANSTAVLTFDISVNGGTTKTVTINNKIATDAIAGLGGTPTADQQNVAVFTAALLAVGVNGITVTSATSAVTFDTADGIGNKVRISEVSAYTSGSGNGVLGFSALGTKTEIEALISTTNVAIESVTKAAAQLGAVAKRIELQQSFVSNLMDTIDKGVSGLVDADMNEESTKLQALQVKQQLGVQALSIANSSAQNVLSLFRS